MIGALRGKVFTIQDEVLILDVNGVGYEITVTASILEKARGDAELSLFIFTDVKENAIGLFGFQNLLEREVFLLLKKVKGIGSKSAHQIVSAIGAERLLAAIGHEDVSVLQSVSGIGKKSAERIIVELREQVALLTGSSRKAERIARNITRFTPVEGDSGEGDAVFDSIQALEKLGFSSEKARLAVRAALDEARDSGVKIISDAGELLKRALAHL